MRPWIAQDVDERDLLAALRLCRVLAGGELAGRGAELEEDGPARALLHYCLALTLDPSYLRSLRLVFLTQKTSDRRRVAVLARTLARGVFPTRAQIDLIYGPQRGWLGYLWKRLWRPFDVVVRLAGHGWAFLCQRARARL